MDIYNYILERDSSKKEHPNKLSSYRQAAELICMCWNNFDVSIIEPYLDENVVWQGPLQNPIQGKENYIKLIEKAFETLKLSKRDVSADIVFEKEQYYARIVIEHQDEDEVNELEIKNGLIIAITIRPSHLWWDKQFDPSPFGVVSQTSFHDEAAAVAAIELYVKNELGNKPIKWERPYEIRNSHCQLSFSCDGLSYDVLVEIHSFDDKKCRFALKSELDRFKAGCRENGHIPCILALNENHEYVSLTLLEDMDVRVQKLRSKSINEWTFRSLFKTKAQLSKLIITKDYRIMLPDYNDIEVKMEPIVKAVYLLFVKHPEGIIFKELSDYREELLDIYTTLKPMGINKRAIQSIEDVTNPLLNSINEKCARIRSAFIKEFDEGLAKNYFVTGERGEKKKITLPRDLIIWE